MGTSNFSIFTNFKAKDNVTSIIGSMTGKAGLLDRVFSKFNVTQNKFGSCFKATMNKANFLMSAFMGSFVFAKIKDFYSKCIEAAETELTAQEKLTQVLKNNANIRRKGGQNAYLSVTQSLFNMASDMQKKGILGDEVLVGGMAALGSMGFDDKVIKTIMPSIADLVVQQKGYNASLEDTENISKGIGKAIAGNAGALSKMGIVLNKTQKKYFSNMTTMQRASLIANLLQSRVGGLNEEFAKTDHGIKINFLNNLSDAFETFGKKLMPIQGIFFKTLNKFLPKLLPAFDSVFNALKYGFNTMKPLFGEFNSLIEYLSKTLMPWLSEQIPTIKWIFEKAFVPACILAIKTLQSLFKIINFVYSAGSNLFNFIKDNWAGILGTVLPGAMAGAIIWFENFRLQMALAAMEGKGFVFWNTLVGKSLSSMYAGFKNLPVIIMGFTKALWGNITALWAQAAAFAATPLGMITIGITALAGVVWLLWKHWDKVKEGAKKFADFMTGTSFGKILSCIFPILGVSALIIKHWDKIKEVVSSAVQKGIESLTKFGTRIKDIFVKAYQNTRPFFELIFAMVSPFGFILKNIPKIVDTVKEIKNGNIKFGNSEKNGFSLPEPKTENIKRNGEIKITTTIDNRTEYKANSTVRIESTNNLNLVPAM